MVDTNPFLPVSSSDGSCPTGPQITHRKPIKEHLTIFFGLLAVGLFAALLIGNNGSDNSHVHENQHGSLASSSSKKPEPLQPVSRGPAAGVSEKSNRLSANVNGNLPVYPWNNSMLSWQRTSFHFQPEKNWMNDPNGPMFYKGWYHFFYQYNPNAAVWGDIVWGHAVSKDLIHWLHLPLAMVADQWYDQNGVWTGSATILPNGKIVMLYTGSTVEAVQVQNLAYPADHSDPLLVHWVKYPGNPVLVPPPGTYKKDFRDPTTAWLTSEGKWRITIGSKINKTGIALIYDTKDFINYEKLDGVLHAVPGTGMWECVDFFPVSKTEENGLDTSVNGPGVKHVVKVSLDDDRHDYYAIGTYHEKNGTWIPDQPEIDVGIGIRYDYGIYYAAKTFYDQNKNRRVLWGWIGESDSEAADMKKGWASVQSIPRTILFDKKTGTHLLQWPVEEIESLRLKSNEFNQVSLLPGSVVPLDVGPATQLDILAEFEIDKEVLKKATGSNITFSCSASGGAAERGALGPFGLLVLADESLSEQTPVYFYITKGSDGNLKTSFCNDQSRSSAASDVNKQIYGSFLPVLKGENLSLRVLVIAINNKFPGPTINATTNNNVVVNVRNKLDEGLLIHWSGIQQRRSSWQDGLPGTNCPIPPKWNWTYQFQVKDQIGSFFYFPSLHFQRAAGGFGSFIINNRAIIPIPFDTPDGDITILIGDWYTRNHTALRKALDAGKDLGMPDGVLINGKGPYRYNDTLVPDGIDYETINVHPGKTYRLRVTNVGISTSLNFRIQSHNVLLAETEGSYTVQQNYTSLDIHVGQSYSFLLTTDQNASSDYYIVASARFVNESQWKRVTGVAILHYSNSKGKAAGPLPDPPQDEYDKTFSMNQARSIRWNVSASGARPNPQGSFRYGSINVTEIIVLENKPPVTIDGKRRTTLSGISFVNPATPIRLADQFKVKGVYKLDFPNAPLTGPPKMETSVINGTYRGFMEVILQNNDTKVQSYHMSGYAFFVVGMDYGEWSENSRGTYNKWDGIARTTTQVYPGAWTAILISLDNVGVWNLRTENLDSWYLGQETYVRVVNPEATNKTELPMPDNALYCGALSKLQKPQDVSLATSITGSRYKLFFTVLMVASALLVLSR